MDRRIVLVNLDRTNFTLPLISAFEGRAFSCFTTDIAAARRCGRCFCRASEIFVIFCDDAGKAGQKRLDEFERYAFLKAGGRYSATRVAAWT